MIIFSNVFWNDLAKGINFHNLGAEEFVEKMNSYFLENFMIYTVAYTKEMASREGEDQKFYIESEKFFEKVLKGEGAEDVDDDISDEVLKGFDLMFYDPEYIHYIEQNMQRIITEILAWIILNATDEEGEYIKMTFTKHEKFFESLTSQEVGDKVREMFNKDKVSSKGIVWGKTVQGTTKN